MEEAMNEFEKFIRSRPYPNHDEVLRKWADGTYVYLQSDYLAFLAGLAAAEDKCAAVSQSFAGSRAAQRGCFACAWAIKAMRERE